MPWLRRYRQAVSFDTRTLESADSEDDSSTSSQLPSKHLQHSHESMTGQESLTRVVQRTAGSASGVNSRGQASGANEDYLKSRLVLLEKENKRLTMTVEMLMSPQDIDSTAHATETDAASDGTPSNHEVSW
jgi:hypothetical protein